MLPIVDLAYETKEESDDETEDNSPQDNVINDEKINEEAEEAEEAEEDDEIFEIEIDDKNYCTNDEENGFIWELSEEGEQGEKVGYLKDGEPFFYADEI